MFWFPRNDTPFEFSFQHTRHPRGADLPDEETFLLRSSGKIFVTLASGVAERYRIEKPSDGDLTERPPVKRACSPYLPGSVPRRFTTLTFSFTLKRNEDSDREETQKRPHSPADDPDTSSDSEISHESSSPKPRKKRRLRRSPSEDSSTSTPAQVNELPAAASPEPQSEQASNARALSFYMPPEDDAGVGTDDPYLNSLYLSREPSPSGLASSRPEVESLRRSQTDSEAPFNDAQLSSSPSPTQLFPIASTDVEIMEEEEEDESPGASPAASQGREQENESRSATQAALIWKQFEDVDREIDAFTEVVLAKSCEEASLSAKSKSAKRALQVTIRMLKQDIEKKKEKRARFIRELKRITSAEVTDLTMDDDKSD
ncbi:hypothetical protein EIP91_008686 [Steccherinum ochraceum]|uniref:Uncharacterized protein n=1 Tax=Steccherinum ochraceum TaxID=92696 RepID=A0A4R0R2H7_9APHY|nr:hypothetical protein EIP91_008686 [Steccherinum ochraceum]